jgi:16S rRNA (guanine1207-N2)-methyltransferase
LAADPTTMLLAAVVRAQQAKPVRPLMIEVAPAIAVETGISAARWTAIEPWKPRFDDLRAAGFDPRPTLQSDTPGFDLLLVRLGRQRARNLGGIAAAVRLARPDALIVVAGENEIGAASYARPLGRPSSMSKHHARAFWFRTEAAPPRATLDAWESDLRPRALGDDGHVAAPGLFAWDRVDRGSALLAAALPADLAGDVADLGSGWGYLAREIAAHCAAVRRISVFEADWHALEAARANLAAYPAEYYWQDVTRELPSASFDAIVTNPPFHASRRADPTIGQRVIRNAAIALRARGTLWLVANIHLPYEATLRACFAQVETRIEVDGYKVIVARGPRVQNVPG